MLPLWGLRHNTTEEEGHIPTPFPKPLCAPCPSRHALQRRCRKGIGTALLGEEGTTDWADGQNKALHVKGSMFVKA